MSSEIDLFGYDSQNKAIFSIRIDRSGIELESFLLKGIDHQITQTLAYKPYGQGITNPGASQLGVYRVLGRAGSELLAVVRDYSRPTSQNYPWGVILVDLTDNAKALMDKYAEDARLGAIVWLGIHSLSSNP